MCSSGKPKQRPLVARFAHEAQDARHALAGRARGSVQYLFSAKATAVLEGRPYLLTILGPRTIFTILPDNMTDWRSGPPVGPTDLSSKG